MTSQSLQMLLSPNLCRCSLQQGALTIVETPAAAAGITEVILAATFVIALLFPPLPSLV